MIALAAITLLGAVLRLVSLAKVPVTPFYDAAVRSMSLSWHNFFYGAFDPTASASVDKPPIDLWIQVLTVKLIGFSSTALKLPSAIAASLAVPLLYDLVRRLAGRTAGLATAVTLAVLPVAVVTARSDTMDSLMMALLVLDAWLLLRYVERRQLRWLILAALVLGLDFNVKLFEALIPVPAFLAFLWLSSYGDPLRSRLGRLAAAAAVSLVVALSWLVVVSLTPRHDRPYPVGSTNGSVWNAVFVYNGTDRLTKPARPSNFGTSTGTGATAGAGASGATAGAGALGATAGAAASGASGAAAASGASGAAAAAGATAGAGAGAGAGAAVRSGTTAGTGRATKSSSAAASRHKRKARPKARPASAPAGPFRLFRRSLVDFGGLVGTILFAALVLGFLALLGSSTRLVRPPSAAPREERTRRAAVVGVGVWLLTGIVLFSFSGRVHPRYLEAFTPAVAVTLGVSISVLAGRLRDLTSFYILAAGIGLALLESLVAVGTGVLARAGLAAGFLVAIVGCGLTYREIAGAASGSGSGRGSGSGSGGGSGAASGGGSGTGRRWSQPAIVVIFSVTGLLAFPVARDISLIRDHSGVQAVSPEFAPRLANALATYLRDHQGTARYEFAATAPSIAAPLIIRDPRPILLLTTVNAQPLVTLTQLEAAVAAHTVSYVVMHGRCPHPPYHILPACSAAAAWVRANGRDVTAQLGDPATKTGVLFQVG
ncbi:MAG TPA: glycosyltransferase family 39 protein [Solirubrobacteraceae bacterium]|nr:glycosyltransferase family 39 protein [Solirubrobacteraceae bacterium]